MLRKASLINFLAVMAASLVLVGWSFASFGADEGQGGEAWVLTGDMSFDQVLYVEDISAAIRNERDSLIVMPGSEVELSWDEELDHLSVKLMKGGLMFETMANDISVSVETDFARVDSENSAAYIELNEETDQLEVYALDHPSLVTFLLEGEELNALSVPTNYRMKIPSSKISRTIGLLRLTKLSKEFPVFELNGDELSDDVLEELDFVKTLYADNSLEFLTEIQKIIDFGPALEGPAAQVNTVLSGLKENLTLLSHAKDRLNEDQKDKYLLYAISNYLFGSISDADVWLEEWSTLEHDSDEVKLLYSSMFFVLPGHDLYPVKAALAEVVYKNEDSLASLRRQYQEVESLLDKAELVDAEEAYQNYQAEFATALDSGVFDNEESLPAISREYILLEILLRSHSLFYNIEDVSLLENLENKMLALAGSDEDLDEEYQAFVQSKIRFLEHLFDFVVDRKVSVDTATDLATELVFSAESYLDSITAKVAVSEYFDSLLKDFDLSIQFMNSPEFYSYADFDEGLGDYREKVDDLAELQEYIQIVREGSAIEEVNLTLEEATGEVEDDLFLAGIQFNSVDSLGDSEYRLFEITGGRVLGYSFEASYDRESQILYDVAFESLRFSTGLRLEKFKDVIEGALAEEETTDEVVDDPNISSSLTEGVAIEQAALAFTNVDLDPENFTFTVVDYEANIFTFEGTITSSDLPVSGTFDLLNLRVSEIVWEYDAAPQSFPDVDLSSFEGAIWATYQALNAAT